MKKDVVIGLGEIGLPIYKIISKHFPVEGIDINPILNKEKLTEYDKATLSFAISKSFEDQKNYEKSSKFFIEANDIQKKNTQKLFNQ